MNFFLRFVKKYILRIAFFIVPVPSLFWLPSGKALMHGPFYPWPENISTMYGIIDYYLYAWLPAGFGFPTTELSGFLFNYISATFLRIGTNPYIGQSLFFYLGFVGILSGMYFLARTLSFNKSASFAAAVFYLFSPFVFTGVPIEMVNFKLIPFHLMTPFLLAFFIRALSSSVAFKKEWAIFGVICYLATAGYGSLQYFAVHLLILSTYGVFFIFSKYYRHISLKKGIFRIGLLFGIMFLVNYFWLSPLLFNLQDSYNLRAEPGFSADHDGSMVAGTSAKIIDALRTMPYPAQISSSPWMAYYYTLMPTVIIFCFLALGAWAIFSKDTRRYALFPGIWLVIALFLVKGVEKPLTVVGKYIFLFQPYITRLFRNITYFELLVVPALALLVGLSIGGLIKKTTSKLAARSIIITVGIAFLIFGKPFITGVALESTDSASPSQYNVVPDYFKETAEFLKNKKENFRVNSIPAFTSQGVFVSYRWDSIYSGTPPLGLHSEKSFYRPLYPQLIGKIDTVMNGVLHPQKNIISQADWNFLLGTGNVRYITMHHDFAWDFLYRIKSEGLMASSESDINKFISESTAIEKVKNFGEVDIYRLKDENYLPHFYIPEEIVLIESGQNFLSERNVYPGKQNRLAIYSQEQNSQKSDAMLGLKSGNNKNSAPVLEFRKINPTKYRVRVHGVNGKFPIVFSEGFHNGWKNYLVSPNNFQIQNSKSQTSNNNQNPRIKIQNIFNQLSNYKILEGNIEEQASREELAEYIKKGWVTDLGDGKEKEIEHIKWEDGKKKFDYLEKYNIDFISRNVKGTIQNDNLPTGNFHETWLPVGYRIKDKALSDGLLDIIRNDNIMELSEKNHLIANGYANSWVIDVDEICGTESKGSLCIKNEDGSYDLGLLVEYKPQQSFYIGLFISGVAVLCCFVFMGISWYKEKLDNYGKKVYKKENDQFS